MRLIHRGSCCCCGSREDNLCIQLSKAKGIFSHLGLRRKDFSKRNIRTMFCIVSLAQPGEQNGVLFLFVGIYHLLSSQKLPSFINRTSTDSIVWHNRDLHFFPLPEKSSNGIKHKQRDSHSSSAPLSCMQQQNHHAGLVQ